ncbi:hypothetical protein IQ06DRAFT_343620 [Phaeosphaeriaceae sp. SRC1lsM3a]|nr:hypothetical protein IQ06DRAFT_343620 [Stagonospora sp. SRC1lsM3a]
MFTRGKASKSRIDAGETLGNDERYPGEAISVPSDSEQGREDEKRRATEEGAEDELSEEENIEDKLAKEDDDDTAEAIEHSKQDLHKRKRCEEDEEGSLDEDNVELDSRKKRLHTKAEADGAQAAPKAEAFHGQESEEDDDYSFI